MSEARATNVFVISAPSGAGKSTVLRQVFRGLDAIRFSISHTTRGPREGEQDGVQYHFVSPEAFQKLIDEGSFLEWARVHGQHYGTCRSEYERACRDGVDLLLDLDVQGAAQVRAQFPEAITIFLLPPSFGDLERRLRGRGQDPEPSVQRRLANAVEEVRRYAEYDYVLVNNDVAECADAVKSIVTAARCRTRRQEPVARRILDTFPPDPRRNEDR